MADGVVLNTETRAGTEAATPMQNLNQVTLIGRVGIDPESQEVNGTVVTKLRIATNRVWKDPQGNKKEATTWHRVVAWDRVGESTRDYCKKGMLVFITGSLETREFQDKQGEKRSITEVKAQQVGFLSGNDGSSQGPSEQRGGYAPAPQQQYRQQGYGQQRQQQPMQQQTWGRQPGQDLPEEDVPF